MTDARYQWLLESDEPWTRYRTLVDLLRKPEDDPEVRTSRAEMLAHPKIKALQADLASWDEIVVGRHNDTSLPFYKLCMLIDFGLRASDKGMKDVLNKILAHQSPEGAFQSLVNIPKSFGGTGEDKLTWLICDAPTLLYILLAMGLGSDERVQRALTHLTSLVDDNGWRCKCSPDLGRFRGPGRKEDPCPIANVFALKALAQAPDQRESPAAHMGVEMLLKHWEERAAHKYYMYGIGSTFRKLKYPLVSYDILHVVDVLSRFPFARSDNRLHEMVKTITDQADENGRYTAGSMYQVWKGWSFADKKNASPWITFLVLRILNRLEA